MAFNSLFHDFSHKLLTEGILVKFLPIAVLTASFLTSFAVFVLCGTDKFCAKRGFRRIPEKVFFILSALGGALGLCFGMIAFHHKTAHWTFRLCAVLFGIIWLILLTAMLLYFGGFILQ